LLDDFWYRPLTLIGGAGPDKGKGGSYLLLPPDYKGESILDAAADVTCKINNEKKN
jgi:hypothetical protein